jgi:DNA invertase Pin-like site-specific DNA recombinase
MAMRMLAGATCYGSSRGKVIRKVGYVRKGKGHQDIEARIAALYEAGCSQILEEVTTRDGKLAQLATLIEALAPADTLVVARLDQLGTSLRDIFECIERIDGAGAVLRSLDEGLDTATAEGRTAIKIFGQLASVNHDLFSERARIGHLAARVHGQKVGRPHLLGKEERKKVLHAIRSEGQTVQSVADRFGVHVRTIYRILDAHGNAAGGWPNAS